MAISSMKPSTPAPASFWQRLGDRLFKPAHSVVDADRKRLAQLLAGLTLATCALTGIRIFVGFRSGSYLTDESFVLLYFFFALMFGSYVASRTRYLNLSLSLFVFAFTGFVYGVIFFRDSSDALQNLNTLVWILPGYFFGAVLFPYWLGFLWMLANMAGLIFLPTLVPVIDGSVTNGLLFTLLVLTVLNLVLNRYRVMVEQDRQSQILAANQQLQRLNADLEERVRIRTRALTTSADVSRQLSTILDPDQLVLQVVEQVKSAFNYYHAHIYFLDERGQNLTMVGGTGEAGQIMLQSGHTISLASGLVGRAARTNQIVLVPDTSNEPGWLSNPLLPETKSEVAVPIAFGSTVMGVLDVQHNVVNGLMEVDAELLQVIASQVAVAIQNARQYMQAQESESRLRAMIDAIPTAVMITRLQDGVVQYANDKAAALFASPLDTLIGHMTPDLYYHPHDRETVLDILKREGRLLNYEVLGRRLDGSPIWVALSVQQMSYAGDASFYVNLTDITERKEAGETLVKRVERDRVLNRIATKIRSAAAMEQVLQIATHEVRQAIGASRATVVIEQPEEALAVPTTTQSIRRDA